MMRKDGRWKDLHSLVADVSRWKFLNVVKKCCFSFIMFLFVTLGFHKVFGGFSMKTPQQKKAIFCGVIVFFRYSKGLKMKLEYQKLQRCGSGEFFSKTDKQSIVFNLILSFLPLDYPQRYVIIHR